MNKGQLVEVVAGSTGTSKAAASRNIDAVIEAIAQGIRDHESVTITGFGTFTRKERTARPGRHPMTGEPMTIKASTTVGFKLSQSLKESLQPAPH